MSDINIGQFAEALNDKMDRDANNIETPRLPIFLVAKQDPDSTNNYTWYRKWSDGHVEQGGRIQLNGAISASNKRVSLPIPMADSRYVVMAAVNANVGSACYVGWESTTAFSVGTVSGSNTGYTTWFVSGMSAN